MSQAPEPYFHDAFKLAIEIERLSQWMETSCGLSLAQWSVLTRLRDLPAATAQELAAAVGVSPSTLTQALKRLERKKWIFVGKDPRDSRKKVLALTREGMKALRRAGESLGAGGERASRLSACAGLILPDGKR